IAGHAAGTPPRAVALHVRQAPGAPPWQDPDRRAAQPARGDAGEPVRRARVSGRASVGAARMERARAEHVPRGLPLPQHPGPASPAGGSAARNLCRASIAHGAAGRQPRPTRPADGLSRPRSFAMEQQMERTITSVRDRARELERGADEQLMEMTGRRLTGWAEPVRAALRDHPLPMLVAVLGAGYLVGKLLRR